MPEFTARTMVLRNSTVANTANARCSQGSARFPYQESTVMFTKRFGPRASDVGQIVGQNILVANDRTEDPGIPDRSRNFSTRGPGPR